jgi:hypothetical protein
VPDNAPHAASAKTPTARSLVCRDLGIRDTFQCEAGRPDTDRRCLDAVCPSGGDGKDLSADSVEGESVAEGNDGLEDSLWQVLSERRPVPVRAGLAIGVTRVVLEAPGDGTGKDAGEKSAAPEGNTGEKEFRGSR